jgi:hypothetical protein
MGMTRTTGNDKQNFLVNMYSRFRGNDKPDAVCFALMSDSAGARSQINNILI